MCRSTLLIASVCALTVNGRFSGPGPHVNSDSGQDGKAFSVLQEYSLDRG